MIIYNPEKVNIDTVIEELAVNLPSQKKLEINETHGKMLLKKFPFLKEVSGKVKVGSRAKISKTKKSKK